MTCLRIITITCVAATAAPGAVDSGRVLLYNRRYTEAARYYQTVLERDSLSVHAHRRYQDAHFGMGDSARAAVTAYYLSRLSADLRGPMEHYLYGRCLPCAEGKEHFAKALRFDRCFAWAHNAIGACEFEASNYDNAKEEFLKAIRCDEDFGEAYQNLAAVYVATGHSRRAQKVFRKLIGRDKKNGQAFEWLGDMYLGQRQYGYSRMAYLKAVNFGVDGPAVFFKAGYTCFELRRHREAVKLYKRSIEQGNDTYEVYYNLASSQEQLQYFEEAIENYTAAYERSGEHKILYSLGNCAVALGLHSQAVRSYEQFLQREPRHTEALFGLANAYQMKKDFDRAIELYHEIILIDSTFSKAYYNLGSIFAYHKKDPAKMEHYWGLFIRKFPGHEDAEFIRKEMEKMASIQ